mmetsp:Transcript_72506/g.194623  ORF Transcript_72506/g.194623 Transcript_72506/m.194623 type:complete len:124 (-) Transcript_72506:90-461(-)
MRTIGVIIAVKYHGTKRAAELRDPVVLFENARFEAEACFALLLFLLLLLVSRSSSFSSPSLPLLCVFLGSSFAVCTARLVARFAVHADWDRRIFTAALFLSLFACLHVLDSAGRQECTTVLAR